MLLCQRKQWHFIFFFSLAWTCKFIELLWVGINREVSTKLVFLCSKLKMEAPEQCVKSAQSEETQERRHKLYSPWNHQRIYLTHCSGFTIAYFKQESAVWEWWRENIALLLVMWDSKFGRSVLNVYFLVNRKLYSFYAELCRCNNS